MSRSLSKVERHNGSEVGWYSEDGTFEMIFYYHQSTITFDVKNERVSLKALPQKYLKLDSHRMRIEDLRLAPWRDELFIHVTLDAWNGQSIENYIQRLKFPINKNVIYAADSTDVIETKHHQHWLSGMGFDHPDRNFILPFTDEERNTVLLVKSLEKPPSCVITEDIDILSCGFTHANVWWIGASIYTPKGRKWFVQAFGKPRFYLPCALPPEGRLRVLSNGSIQASMESKGDRWATYGTF